MDGFKNKFIKLAYKINDGEILTDELDKYVKENSDKSIFKKAIIELMDSSENIVKILASRYGYDYCIDEKKAYKNATEILRKDKSLVCRVEAKHIFDQHKRRHVRKLTSFILKRMK